MSKEIIFVKNKDDLPSAKMSSKTADTVDSENTAKITHTDVKKVTLEKLIQKKLEKDGKRNATKEIYVESLDGNITVNNPTDTQRIEFADKTRSGSYVDMVDAYIKLIYDNCPMLHSKDLQKEIGVSYPYDTVKAIFDVDEIIDIGVQVLRFFDDEEEEADENLKN